MRSILMVLATTAVLASPLCLAKLEAAEGDADPKAELRAKYKEEKKVLTWDMTYFVDMSKFDSRWTIPEQPHPNAKEEDGLQLRATWQARSDQPVAITVLIWKSQMSTQQGSQRTVYSKQFKNIGESVSLQQISKIAELTYEDWVKGADEVETKRCTAAKKKSNGPAKFYATAVGKASHPSEGEDGQKKRLRWDWYTWSEPNELWEAWVIYDGSILDSDTVVEQGESFMKSVKETPKGDLKKVGK